MTFTEALKTPSMREAWKWIWSAPLVLFALQAQSVAPIGHYSLLWLELPYACAIMAAVCAILVLPFLALRRAGRASALAWLLAAVTYLVLAVAGLLLGNGVRRWGFDRLALRSAPLVAAIKSYETEHRKPPPTLEALVPAYLPQVPRTGIMAYPRYEYHTGAEAMAFDNNPWVLVIPTPSGGINFDQFMYFPLQNYPQQGYGGSLERVRDWAYVHE